MLSMASHLVHTAMQGDMTTAATAILVVVATESFPHENLTQAHLVRLRHSWPLVEIVGYFLTRMERQYKQLVQV